MLRLSSSLHLVLGLTLWCLWFVAIYGGLSVACSVAPPAGTAGPFTWVNLVLLLLTAATAGMLCLLAWRCWRTVPTLALPVRRFVLQLSAGLYLAAALATLAVGLPVVLLPPCV